MEDSKVTSELYSEHEYATDLQPEQDCSNVVSKFAFRDIPHSPQVDSDGDLEVIRRKRDDYNNFIDIEHSQRTELKLVGLQIWRGALLLADWLISYSGTLPGNYLLELGSGVGLTSIIASMFKPIICTDIDIGGLLNLIRANVKRNKKTVKNPIKVMELDFTSNFSKELSNLLPEVEVILAADVVYDDRLTKAFMDTIQKLLLIPPKKSIFVALEKRYVFTLAELDTCAPCYEYFKECLHNLENVKVEQLPLDFPQYFNYDRVKDLVLWKISNS